MSDRVHPSDFAWIQYRQLELEPARRAELEVHLTGCEFCRQRLDAMRTEQMDFLRQRPFHPEILETRASAPRRRAFRWPLLAGACAAGLLLLTGLAALVLWLEVGSGDEGIRLKGAALDWIVLRDGEQFAWTDQPLRAGDRLGIAVTSPVAAQVVVLSVEAKGEVRILLPAAGVRAFSVMPAHRTALPFSLRVEAPVAPQRLIVLLGSTDLDAARLAEQVRQEAVDMVVRGQPGYELHAPPPGLLSMWRSSRIEVP